jgi:hypothetical protein
MRLPDSAIYVNESSLEFHLEGATPECADRGRFAPERAEQ